MQYVSSSDTEDFIREVTERHNISRGLLTKVNSEDETSNPFSLSSSRHSLLIVESDLEEDGSSSPEMLCSPIHVVEKEPRNSYSLSSCSITLSPPLSNELTLEARPDAQKASQSEASRNVMDKEADNNSSTLTSLPIFKRQGRFLDSAEDTELNPVTPTNLLTPVNLDGEGGSLSTTPVPCIDIRSDGDASPG